MGHRSVGRLGRSDIDRAWLGLGIGLEVRVRVRVRVRVVVGVRVGG